MKKNKKHSDVLPEYDFAKMEGGVRGKYVARYRAGTNLVLLDPEIHRAFPTSAAVNQTLRAVLKIAKTIHPNPRRRGTG
jgi:alpha-beta hydrolase superfamily lysophospholipase